MKQAMDKIAERARGLVPVAVLCVAVVVIVCIPLKVISYGYIPPDDAMRHAAKAVSGKSWDQVLVVRPGFSMDSHPGWHKLLGAVNVATGCGRDGLIMFSVAFLFILFAMIPVFFLDYPEAWLAALLGLTVMAPHLINRLFLGRPFIVTMAVLLVIFFLWPSLRGKKRPYGAMAAVTALVALSTWIHASWYLFALPIACFFAAREFRAGLRLAACAVAGVAIGASLTGHPCIFLKQTVNHVVLAFGRVPAQRLLVGEFQPFSGDAVAVLFIMGMLLWRLMRTGQNRKAVYNPIFIIALSGWALGFFASRFWTDWGMPAAAFWIMAEIHSAMAENIKPASWQRVWLALAVSAALFLAVTSDVGSRWTYNLTTEYLSAEDPKQAEWLPGEDGIIYSNDMRIFYQTYYSNPRAPWRYMLGFEPAMMPAEDLAVLRKIHWNSDAYQAFDPWVEKMRPQDRMIVRGDYSAKPNIKGLDWYYAATGTWIGRLPRR